MNKAQRIKRFQYLGITCGAVGIITLVLGIGYSCGVNNIGGKCFSTISAIGSIGFFFFMLCAAEIYKRK